MSVSPANRRLDRRDLDARPFPPEACQALFGQILIDDDVDPDLRLPDTVPLDHAEDELIACFRLSRELWKSGFDRDALLAITATLVRERDLDADDRVRLTHIRAKFKHFRYAHALYGGAHRYPPMFDRITTTMGQAQDAYRNRRRGAAGARGALLRLLLSAPAVRWLNAEADSLTPTTSASFRALLERDRAALEALVARPTVTGPIFHAARKMVGRQGSFWNALLTLAPDETRYRITRWISAINGEMGALHDRLVEARARDRASYRRAFVLPEDIRDRIVAFCGRM